MFFRICTTLTIVRPDRQNEWSWSDAAPDGVTPTLCPYGHPLGPGLTQIAWRPCRCRSAQSGHGGHTMYLCTACAAAGRTTIAYRPEHIRTAADVEQSLGWVRHRLERAEASLATCASAGWQHDALAAEVDRLKRALEAGERDVAALRAAKSGNRGASSATTALSPRDPAGGDLRRQRQ